MSKRKEFTGTIGVYRQGPLSSELTGLFEADGDGKDVYYHPAPQAFVKLTYKDGRTNTFRVTFTANADGSNPRGVKVL